MRRLWSVALFLPVAAAVLPAAASEAVIRGAAISFSNSGYAEPAVSRSRAPRIAGVTTILRGIPAAERGAPVYSGSSTPPVAGGTAILRGSRPAETVRQTPVASLGGDTDGPVVSPACLHTEPPTCR